MEIRQYQHINYFNYGSMKQIQIKYFQYLKPFIKWDTEPPGFSREIDLKKSLVWNSILTTRSGVKNLNYNEPKRIVKAPSQ